VVDGLVHLILYIIIVGYLEWRILVMNVLRVKSQTSAIYISQTASCTRQYTDINCNFSDLLKSYRKWSHNINKRTRRTKDIKWYVLKGQVLMSRAVVWIFSFMTPTAMHYKSTILWQADTADPSISISCTMYYYCCLFYIFSSFVATICPTVRGR
jgi:hypothetical protein